MVEQRPREPVSTAEPTAGAGPGTYPRRRFFGAPGAAGAAAAVALVGGVGAVAWGEGREAQAAPPEQGVGPSGAPRQWVMVFDLRKCEGCVTQDKPPQCAEGCHAEHFVPRGQDWIRIFRVETPGGNSYFLPRPCMQCENAPCQNVCPVGATFRNKQGVVLIDHDKCIGCRLCMAACPYSARSFNWGQPENPPGATFAKYSPEYPVPHRKGTAEKCMLCAHRTKDGKLPACAEACPMNAIYLGDLTEDVATNGKEVVQLSRLLADRNAFRLKEELGTRPRVWYLPGHGQDYGRTVDDQRLPKTPRPWQEQTEKKREVNNGSHEGHLA